MNKIAVYCLALLFVLSSCAKNEKKFIVFNHGTAKVDVDNKTLTIKEGVGNQDHEMFYDSKNKIVIKVSVDGKNFDAEAAENGYYFLNAKNDTIIGTMQSFTAKVADETYYSLEVINARIDSLNNLIIGKNIGKNMFYILPYSTTKITDKTSSIIIPPFHNKSRLEPNADGSIPDVYRFYTVNEIREKVNNLVEYTKPKGKKKAGEK